jgi:hypothetical protein
MRESVKGMIKDRKKKYKNKNKNKNKNKAKEVGKIEECRKDTK